MQSSTPNVISQYRRKQREHLNTYSNQSSSRQNHAKIISSNNNSQVRRNIQKKQSQTPLAAHLKERVKNKSNNHIMNITTKHHQMQMQEQMKLYNSMVEHASSRAYKSRDNSVMRNKTEAKVRNVVTEVHELKDINVREPTRESKDGNLTKGHTRSNSRMNAKNSARTMLKKMEGSTMHYL